MSSSYAFYIWVEILTQNTPFAFKTTWIWLLIMHFLITWKSWLSSLQNLRCNGVPTLCTQMYKRLEEDENRSKKRVQPCKVHWELPGLCTVNGACHRVWVIMLVDHCHQLYQAELEIINGLRILHKRQVWG